MATNNKLGEIIIINEELFKNYSNVSRNVGVDKVFPYLQLAQPYYIENILGEPLLFELQTQIAQDNLTELNKALILKVAPALSLWTDYLAARSLAYSFTAKGLTKEKSENSESLNDKELAEYIHAIREQAEMASQLLVKYLCRCASSYPLWAPDSDCDCSKYLQENNGTAQKPEKNLIYFPSGRPDKCPKCNRD